MRTFHRLCSPLSFGPFVYNQVDQSTLYVFDHFDDTDLMTTQAQIDANFDEWCKCLKSANKKGDIKVNGWTQVVLLRRHCHVKFARAKIAETSPQTYKVVFHLSESDSLNQVWCIVASVGLPRHRVRCDKEMALWARMEYSLTLARDGTRQTRTTCTAWTCMNQSQTDQHRSSPFIIDFEAPR